LLALDKVHLHKNNTLSVYRFVLSAVVILLKHLYQKGHGTVD